MGLTYQHLVTQLSQLVSSRDPMQKTIHEPPLPAVRTRMLTPCLPLTMEHGNVAIKQENLQIRCQMALLQSKPKEMWTRPLSPWQRKRAHMDRKKIKQPTPGIHYQTALAEMSTLPSHLLLITQHRRLLQSVRPRNKILKSKYMS